MSQSPFIKYLRQIMIFNKPSSAELKSMLEKKITEIKSSEERVEILNEIKKLWESRDIDVYYKGGIMDFKSYIEYRIVEEAVEEQVEWNELYKELNNKHIRGISIVDFNKIMTYHILPKNANRVVWIGKRYEGFAFSKHFGFNKLSDFKKCFVPEDGNEFRGNDNTQIKEPFSKLIDKYKRP